MLALLALSTPAWAVYKCEAAGKTVYSDTPCRDIGAHEQEIRLAPAAGDPQDAQQRLQQEKKELQRLENARARQEAADDRARQRARKAQQARNKKCKELALRVKWAREDADSAAGRARDKAQRSLRRAEEKQRLSCDA
ncbi:MAG TPA: DUF4124 domain-containing protein [Oxalicibacterium sp.]|nr:DUF4124 domain-containing protein [Oxalicibacterium sp.]